MSDSTSFTDDADRMPFGCDTFLPGEDYDPMYDAPSSEFRCGRGEFGDPCCIDPYTRKFVGPGCRHCCPPDRENKPYGFGIEQHDSPAWDKARAHFRNEWRFVTGRFLAHPADYKWLIRKWAVGFGWNERLAKRSDRKWEQFCGVCETHGEAVERYIAWAQHITHGTRCI